MPLSTSELSIIYREAMHHARKVIIRNGSVLKTYPDIDTAFRTPDKTYTDERKNKKRDKYSPQAVAARQDSSFGLNPPRKHGTFSLQELAAYENRIRCSGTGNGLEYSIIIFFYIRNRLIERPADLPPLDIVSSGNHAWVVVNQPEADVYPLSPDDWNKSAMAIDGWANILGFMRDFSSLWISKMMSWKNRGMEIDGLDPTRRHWLYTPVSRIKRSVIRR